MNGNKTVKGINPFLAGTGKRFGSHWPIEDVPNLGNLHRLYFLEDLVALCEFFDKYDISKKIREEICKCLAEHSPLHPSHLNSAGISSPISYQRLILINQHMFCRASKDECMETFSCSA
jgi:hypothetical protein